MQKNEKSLGEGGGALADGVLGSGAAKGTLGLFLLLARRPGRRVTRAETKPPKHLLKLCSCCHEGGRGLVSPPGRQGSSETHLRQPWGQEMGKKP
jgi:hypothetical protein